MVLIMLSTGRKEWLRVFGQLPKSLSQQPNTEMLFSVASLKLCSESESDQNSWLLKTIKTSE